MKRIFLLMAMVAAAFLCVRPFRGTQSERPSLTHTPAPGRPAGPPPSAAYGRIPLQFVPNEGQAGGPAGLYVQGRDKTIYFSEEGLTFVLGGGGPEQWAVKLDFVDKNGDAKPVGLEKSGAVISYFKGKPEDWKVGVPTYAKIAYRELWPGIDLVYSGSFDRMKYEFVVRPGADPSRIRLAYRGAGRVELTSEGRLAVATPAGGFLDEVPAAYQEVGGEKVEVTVSYEPETPSPGGSRPGETAFAYGFRIGEYDRGRTLVLDPEVLVYCGFIGGAANDAAHGIDITGSGVLIAGETSSTELTFPVTAGPVPAYAGGASDAFVAKINEDGTALVFCAYIGGAGLDRAAGVLSNGVVFGSTDSTEATFPVAVGPDLTYNGGASDAFVAKINEDGTALEYCGYIGGAGLDCANAAAVDFIERVYVAGSTDSTEATFPVLVGPDLTYNGGDSDAFIAAIDLSGAALLFCGYVGGAELDEALDITCQGPFMGGTEAQVFIAGRTSSWESSFPVTVGPDLTYNGGPTDAFVARVTSPDAVLDLCGYLGGDGTDEALGLSSAIEGDFFSRAAALYVTGSTSSTEATFPVNAGPDLTYNGGSSDAFIIKMGGAGMGTIYCGYIGGGGEDVGIDVACYTYVVYGGGYSSGATSYSDAYVAGFTSSTESTFPVAYGPDVTYNGGACDAFIARLSDSHLTYCGYVGGSGMDKPDGLAVVSSQGALDRAYMAGYSDSTEATFPVTVGPDLTYNGGASDAFAAQIEQTPPTLTSISPAAATAGGPELTLTIVGSSFLEGAQGEVDYPDPYDPMYPLYVYMDTTFVSDTELRAVVPPQAIAYATDVFVRVHNPDGLSSAPLALPVLAGVPSVSSLSPAGATGGNAGLDLSVTGSYFVYGSTVLWNGQRRNTTYVSGSELRAAIVIGDLKAGGEAQITVFNPGPDGGVSNAIVFPVSSFAMTPSPAKAKVVSGQPATYTIKLTPQFGTFDADVNFACTGLPPHCTASFSPTTVKPGAAAASTTLTLATEEPSGAAALAAAGSAGGPLSALAWLLALVPTLFWPLFRGSVHGALRPRRLAAAALILALVVTAGCGLGGGSSTKTRAGTYEVMVNGTSGNLVVAAIVTLVVE